MTYNDILSLKINDFIEHVFSYLAPIDVDFSSPQSTENVSARLANMANIMVYFAEIDSRLSSAKRLAKWDADDTTTEDKKYKKRKYEDLVDKEKVIARAISTLEMQYKALNRAILIYFESKNDNYMPGSVSNRF